MPPVDRTRYARQLALNGFGEAGQARLAAARVVVVGAGGVGSAVLPVLAAVGIRELVVVDPDLVEASNLHRQHLYGPADVGTPKVDAALAALRPRTQADLIGVRQAVTAANAADAVRGADIVLDCTDSPEARAALDAATLAAGVPFVWGSAAGYDGHVGVSLPDRGPRYRDLFPAGTAAADCQTIGVLPSLCTQVGGALATETIKLLTGVGEPLVGVLLVLDALRSSTRAVPYAAAAQPEAPQEADAPEPVAALPAEVTAADLALLLEQRPDLQLVDVREHWEVEIAAIEGARILPLGTLPVSADDLDPDRPVVLFCHKGVRSQRAAHLLAAAGFQTTSVAGGIDAWSRSVDPGVARY